MEGLIKAVDVVPMPSSPQELIDVLTRVLTKPFVEKIVIRSGHDLEVTWHRALTDNLEVSGDNLRAVDAVIGALELSEISAASKNQKELVQDAMVELTMRGLEVTHLLCGSVDFFKKWMGLGKWAEKVQKLLSHGYYEMME